MFYVKFWVRICIPMRLHLFEKKQQQLLKYFSVVKFTLWRTISNFEIAI